MLTLKAPSPANSNTSAMLQPLRWQPMALAHLDSVMAIEQTVYPHPWTRGNFADALQSNYHAPLLWAGDELAAYFVAMQGVEEAHLLNFTVAKAHQGKRLARHLFQTLCSWAQGTGARQLWLEVRKSNTHAQGIYAHWGFETVGERKNYYPAAAGQREDALVMGLSQWP